MIGRAHTYGPSLPSFSLYTIPSRYSFEHLSQVCTDGIAKGEKIIEMTHT